MRKRKKGMRYKSCEKKREKKISLLQELCRINYKIKNIELIKKLGISKTEFYRNYKELANKWREENSKEALF
ncbi:hypothetical protein I6E36_05950 [Fusobacterium mortiferum]|mgnify:FL=1|uniref:hypothetical protein n=1 Tax=Fusobacterium mortiferum TaxID=850 RepID=UPI001F1DB212|nr:hypothetical protein [Fusobacterium mortiferum]MCF2627624.1 hypothetical protein [Fusobacterium mortiferum]